MTVAVDRVEMQPAKLKCSRPNCDAHGGLHEDPKTALSPALMMISDCGDPMLMHAVTLVVWAFITVSPPTIFVSF